MRHQIIEISNQYPLMPPCVAEKSAEVMDGLYWINVYPPMELESTAPLVGSKQLCPWSLAAEFADSSISKERKQHVLDTLRKGKRTMKQFELPPSRVMFMEDNQTKKISVWVD